MFAMPPPRLQPLFAQNERLWLRIWVATQTAAAAAACFLVVDGAGGLRPLLRSAGAPSTLAVVALLILYHVIGVRAHTWMMRRAWSVALFVPLGWGLLVAAVSLHAPFSLLLFGAILQGFVFLPYTAAIATLGIVVLWAVAVVLRTPSGMYADLTVARVAGLLATGIMLGTVMLYIHRVNRDRRHSLPDSCHDLERAERDLADRARDAGVQEERQRLCSRHPRHAGAGIHERHQTSRGRRALVRRVRCYARTPSVSDAMSHVANAQDVSRTSLAEIRRVVWALRPTQLVETPLAAAIERTVARVERRQRCSRRMHHPRPPRPSSRR